MWSRPAKMWSPNEKVRSPKLENVECNFWHTYSLTFKMTNKSQLFGENAINIGILTHLKRTKLFLAEAVPQSPLGSSRRSFRPLIGWGGDTDPHSPSTRRLRRLGSARRLD